MHEIAVNTAHLLVCASHVSKPLHFMERCFCSIPSLSGKKMVPANPSIKKSQRTSNMQKLKKDLQVTPEEPTPLPHPNKSSF